MNTRQHLVTRWRTFQNGVRKWWGRSRAELKIVDMERPFCDMERPFWPFWMP